MGTVGADIAPLDAGEGFLVVIAMALAVLLMGHAMHIPVSTSQAVVGAVIGAGLTKGVRAVRFGVCGRIAIAWLTSPLAAGLLCYLLALATAPFLS